jgi:hypothetical protein
MILTKHLVQLQIEPRLEFDVPRNALTDRSLLPVLVNRSACDVENVNLVASIAFRDQQGNTVMMKCVDSIELCASMKPKERKQFDIAKYFDKVTEIRAEHDKPDSLEIVRGTIVLGISFRRSVDGREFAFEEPYSAIYEDGDAVSLAKAGPRNEQKNLERYIVKKKRC